MGDLSEEKSIWALIWSKSLASHADSDGHLGVMFWIRDAVTYPLPGQFVTRYRVEQAWLLAKGY